MRKELEPQVVEGGKEVMDCLHAVLKKAEEEKNINFIMITYTTSPSHYETMVAGVYGMEGAANLGLDLLKQRILLQLQSRALVRKVSEEVTADHVICNLPKMPMNFDFLSWLVVQEMNRVREGAPAPLKVQWFHGNDGRSCLDTLKKQHNFDHILRPMLTLIGAVEEEFNGSGRLVESCSLGPAVEGYRRGEQIPLFVVPKEFQNVVDRDLVAQCGKRPVTITLREADHYDFRNSNLTEWLKLARYLKNRGEEVLFIRDTDNAIKEIEGFKICPPASFDLLSRAAVYKAAKANLFVSNGPAMLAVFMDVPWLIFNEVREKWPNTSEAWLECAGIRPPEQWPWCEGKPQRIIWQEDKFEIMRDAWEEYIAPSLGG